MICTPDRNSLTAFEMVEQPARRGDQHVGAAVDRGILILEADTADQKRLGELEMLGIGVERLGHLGGQFASRRQHQAARHPRPGAALGQKRDHRQGEARRLAGAGLGDAQNVATFQRGRDRLGLDRRGGFVAGLGHGLQNLGVQVQIGEFCHLLVAVGAQPVRVGSRLVPAPGVWGGRIAASAACA
jgi:hypothetical protein